MKIGLVVLTSGKWHGQFIPVRRSGFLIGRDRHCDLRPASALVSKRHCSLQVRGRKVFVCDLDSLNGTFVNNQPVKGERELHHKDCLTVGPLRFAVRIEPGHGAKQLAETLVEDSAAAFLLSLPAELDASKRAVNNQGVSTGSTQLDALLPSPPAGTGEPERPWTGKPHPAGSFIGDTPGAAESILQKYLRRPRRR